MYAFAITALLASAAMAYAIGVAVIAPRDSFLRTKRGIWLLVIGGLSLLVLPPQLTALGGSVGSLATGIQAGVGASAGTTVPAGATESITGMFAWPSGLDKGLYMGIWLVTSTLGLLAGMQIWNVRKPGWRSRGSNAYDSSVAGRVRGLLPLSDSLAEGLDTIARSGIDARGTELLAEELRGLGRRFAAELPEGSGATYNLVMKTLSPSVANVATKYLLEGVAERRQAQAGADKG